MAANASNDAKKTVSQIKICKNCNIEFQEGIEKCEFCEEFGGSDKDKLSKIREFSNKHFSRGYLKGLINGTDFRDMD